MRVKTKTSTNVKQIHITVKGVHLWNKLEIEIKSKTLMRLKK